MNEKMSNKMKILGFLMTCLMVFYHCPVIDMEYAFNVYDLAIDDFITHMVSAIGVLVMSYFFTVTGFLLFQRLNLKNYKDKLKRRMHSLLIPYILWQCIITVIDILQKQYVFEVRDFLTRTFALQMWPENGAMWYLYAVFILALLSPLLLILFNNKHISWIVIMILIIIIELRNKINMEEIRNIITYGYIGNILTYLPAYLIGCFYGKFADENTQSDSLKYIVVLLISAFFIGGTKTSLFGNIAIQVLPIMILFLLPMGAILENMKIYKLTFLIYAIHQPLIRDLWPYIYGIYTKIIMPMSICNLVTKIIILFVDIVLSCIVYCSLKRFAPKGLKILTGGRF